MRGERGADRRRQRGHIAPRRITASFDMVQTAILGDERRQTAGLGEDVYAVAGVGFCRFNENPPERHPAPSDAVMRLIGEGRERRLLRLRRQRQAKQKKSGENLVTVASGAHISS